MRRIALAASLIALVAFPASANPTQLARSVGVEPGLYSTSQLIQLRNLQAEGGNSFAIERILENPKGEGLSFRLSTTGLGDNES